MEKKLLIEGMSCNHCVNHLTTALCSYYPHFPHSRFHPQSSSNEESDPPKSMMNFMFPKAVIIVFILLVI